MEKAKKEPDQWTSHRIAALECVRRDDGKWSRIFLDHSNVCQCKQVDLNERLQGGGVEMNRDNFDLVIGRLDRVLSEFLCLYEADLDEPDRQTLKHHADDLIGFGKKMHSELAKVPVSEDAAGQPPISAERMKFLVENPPWS